MAGGRRRCATSTYGSLIDLEEHSLDPMVERRCAECGAQLTRAEIQASLESGGPFLCSVHAAEDVPVQEEPEAEE